jgi:outer membrane lipoprotein SlyB
MNRILLLAIVAATLSACASKPILLPNQKYNRVGQAGSDIDVDTCMKSADATLEKTRGRRVMKGALTGAAIGAGLGALSGSQGRTGLIGGAVAGGAIGGAGGAALGAMSNPEDARRNLVNYCLRQKGYAVAGWD